MSLLSRQCKILNISQTYRPPRHATGITLLFTILIILLVILYSCGTKSLTLREEHRLGENLYSANFSITNLTWPGLQPGQEQWKNRERLTASAMLRPNAGLKRLWDVVMISYWWQNRHSVSVVRAVQAIVTWATSYAGSAPNSEVGAF
jgi:hypothetical protein